MPSWEGAEQPALLYLHLVPESASGELSLFRAPLERRQASAEQLPRWGS